MDEHRRPKIESSMITTDMDPGQEEARLQTWSVFRTLFAVFDDTIDTELALVDLRKANLPPEEISAILREQVIDMERSISNQTILSRVVATSALDAVSGWLRGLLTLVLSDRAAYVVAGPIGVLLASSRDETKHAIWDDWTSAADMPGFDLRIGQLARALTQFGLPVDEAAYVEQRVIAGSTLIALTSANVSTLQNAHAIFSRRTAVHVGLGRTDRSVISAAAELLISGPQAGNGSVVVADAISPLVQLSSQAQPVLDAMPLIGKHVFSQAGELLGEITEVLLEKRDVATQDLGPDAFVQRYIVVRHWSAMRLRRWVIAIPTEAVELSAQGFALKGDLAKIRRAPRFNSTAPLSRQQEVRIRQYFNVPHYWLDVAETEQTDKHE